MTPLNIGFIGLGVMGTPMATHLAQAGHRLTLHDATTSAANALAATLGAPARAVATPAAVGECSEIVITMLPNGEVVRDVALGASGLVHGLQRGALLLDTSSAQPGLTRETAAALAQRGVGVVDAPVSGAQWGAQAAELVFMVGGEGADVERVRPLLYCMGRSVFHLGPLGSGHAMKCINNLITAMTFSATTEGLVIGKRFGLDPVVMTEVLNESTGMSWISRNHIAQRITSRSFDDPFKLDLMLKDIGIAMELARESRLALPLAGLAEQLWRAAAHAAGPGASISTLARWVETQTGTALTPGAAGPRESAHDKAPVSK